MARTSYSRDSYVGGAPQARLLADITDSDTTITVTGTNAYWNTLGKSGADDAGFFLCLSIGSANEEKVYVPGGAYSWTATSVTLTNVVRGQDGTPASAHSASDPVTPVMTATDLNEANYAVSQTVGKIAAQGDLLYGNGANEFAKLSAGTAGYFLKTNGAGAAPAWSKVNNVAASSGASPLTVTPPAGYSNYIVLADVTVTQPAASPAAGSITLASSGKTVGAFSGAVAQSVATANLSFNTTSSSSFQVTASKGSSLPAGATLSNINVIVIGLN